MEPSFKLQSPVSLVEKGGKGLHSLLSKNVIVLAQNFTLSKAQFGLLNKGLTFIPTIDIHRDQKTQLKFDLQNYHRKIKLALYFKDGLTQEMPPFTPASRWVPPQDKLIPQVDLLIEKDEQEFRKHFRSFREEPNLSQDEVTALRELMRNRHIVIKPADKGSAVVILSRDQYIMEVNRQLNDKIYYRKLKEPIYLQTIPLVNDILNKLHKNKFISAKQKTYLKGSKQPRPRRFYILPKIHKDPEKWTVPFKIPPGRPIVSDCDSETYCTAEFIDYFLNPISVKHPSYIKDTYHFIDMVKKLIVPPNSLFFSIDINSLYTNIDTPSGLRAVQKMFRKYPDDKRPDKEVLELLEINLNRNDFEFNGEYYLQIKGTAMGKRFAPAYANIFMAIWEEEALAKCKKKPLYYLRYLDDIWGIWIGSRQELDNFINILNTHDPSIKLTYNVDKFSVDFLDTTVYKGTTYNLTHKLDVKVYFKSTDTHALLYKTSFHPQHTYKGLIKSQLIRFKRICTQELDFKEAVKTLFDALKNRGYSQSFLRKCLKSFLTKKPGTTKKIIPLITTFSTVSTILNHKFKTNFQRILEGQGFLKDHQVISAYRKNKSLSHFLVRAELKPVQDFVKTNVALSNFCNKKYVKNRLNKTIFKIPQTFNIQTSNCVYIIICKKCGKQYIGETKNSISMRMMQHRYNVRHKKEANTPLVKHFILHGWQSVQMSAVQSDPSWSDLERKKWERRWIYWLNTKEPNGLNIKYN